MNAEGYQRVNGSPGLIPLWVNSRAQNESFIANSEIIGKQQAT
jgi:hypothetical protein